MTDNNFGELIFPQHCRVSASADKSRIALTFQGQDLSQPPFTIVLPVAGAAGLQRNLAQTIYIMTAKPPQSPQAAAAEPVAAVA